MEPGSSIIRQAAEKFTQGAYQEAQQLYQQAASLLGIDNVKANLWLCDQRMGNNPPLPGMPTTSPVVRTPSVDELTQQLNETQLQLEYYYNCYQQLKHRALDAK